MVHKHQKTMEQIALHYYKLEKLCEKLEKKIIVLEEIAQVDKAKQNRIILCEIVKSARAKILNEDNLSTPTLKENWYPLMNSLTHTQLVKTKVSLKCWPQMKELLSPSTMMLKEWVNGNSQSDFEAMINEMSVNNQIVWKELYKIVKSN